MSTQQLEEGFTEALAIIRQLEPKEGEYVSIDVKAGDTSIAYFPSEENKEASVRRVLALSRKVKKDSDGLVRAKIGTVEVKLFSVLKCEIKGYKTVERPIMKATGEIETFQQPIYDCRLPFEEVQ